MKQVLGALCFCIFSIAIFIPSASENKSDFEDAATPELKSKNYDYRGRKTFYLTDGTGRLVDSMTLYHMTFIVDSLIKKSQTEWHYIYNARCGSGCNIVKELFINTKKSKLDVSFAFTLLSSMDLGNWSKHADVQGLSGVQYEIKPQGQILVLRRSEFSDKNPHGGKRTDYKVKYDAKRNAFYNGKIFYNGNCTVAMAPDYERIKIPVNDTICVIKTEDEITAKINGHWYRYRENEKCFLDF